MIVWPGLRRSVSAIRRLFNSASFDAPLTHSAIPTRAASGTTATFTRATAKTWPNNDGYLVTGVAGEIGFVGARRVDNLIRLGAAQSSTLAVAASVTMTLPAGAYQFSMGAGTGTVTFSGTGGATGTLAASASGRTFVAKTISAGTLIVTASVATLTDIQVVSMVAETDQTTLREYVSVGVTSAPYYHGSMVDGVKCFPTDLSGNPLPLNYTYDAVSLNGVSGTYVSTPDSVAASITGDIDIRVKASLADWVAPSAHNILVSKLLTAGQYSYDWYVQTGSNFMMFRHSTDGTAVVSSPATAAVSFTDGTAGWVRVTRVASTGVVTFYTSSDGTTWTQLGNTVASASGAIFDGNTALAVGANATGASPISGKIYRAQIYNGINGTLAVDFDASRYTGGTTLTGSTGEIWTLQGSAVVHPTNQPNLGYSAEGARTNLCLQSNAFTTTWTKSAGMTLTQNAVGPDGTTTAWSATAAGGAFADYFTQTITGFAANLSGTFSIYLKQGTTTSVRVYVYNTTGGVSFYITVDLTTGAYTTGSAGGTVSGYSVTPAGNGYYRVAVTGTTNGTGAQTNAVAAYAATAGTFYAYGAQVELGSFASSYIATTTIAVARNADVLTYSGGDVANIKTLHVDSFRRDTGVSTVGAVVSLNDGTTSNYMNIALGSATDVSISGVAAAAGQWAITGTYSATTQAKSSFSAATNDIKAGINGTALTPDTSATVPAVTTLSIGHITGTAQLDGNVGGIYGWTRNLSQSELNAVTA